MKALVLAMSLVLVSPSFAIAATDSQVVKIVETRPINVVATPSSFVPEQPPVISSESTQSVWQNILMTIITSILTVVVPVLSYLIMLLLKKIGLKVEQEKIDWILDKSTGFGDQYAKNMLKDGKPVSGPEIARVAANYGNKLAKIYAPKLTTYIEELIEARLGQVQNKPLNK